MKWNFCRIISRYKNHYFAWIVSLFLFFLPLSGYSIPNILETHSLVPLENLLTGMLLEPDGSLLVLENDGGRITRLTLGADKRIKNIDILYEGLTDPVALQRMSDGSFLVGERKTGRIIQIKNQSGKIIADGFLGLSSLRINKNGIAWITQLDTGRLSYYNPATGEQNTLLSNLDSPSDVFPLDNGLILTELVGPPGMFGRVSFGFFPPPLSSSPGTKIVLMPNMPDDSNPISWIKDESVTDPVRIAPDLRNPDNFFISVRSSHPDSNPHPMPDGAILKFNTKKGKADFPFIDNLLAPTEIVSSTDGLYVIEEMAEQISFISWQGERRIVWDGLGGAGCFAYRSGQNRELYALKNFPDSRIMRIDGKPQIALNLPEEFRHEMISGIACLEDGSFLLSVTSQGLLIKIKNNDPYTLVSYAIFAPGKILLSNDGTFYVLDNILGSVSQLEITTGKFLRSIRDDTIKLMDFDLETDSQSPTKIVTIDSRNGTKLVYDETLGHFTSTGFTQSKGFPNLFARIPKKGFVVALNDMDGTLVWSGDDGEESVLTRGYSNINQISYNGNNKITVLSRNGWIRTLILSFDNPVPDWPEY